MTYIIYKPKNIMKPLVMSLIILVTRVVSKNVINNFFPNLPVVNGFNNLSKYYLWITIKLLLIYHLKPWFQGEYKSYVRVIEQCKRMEGHMYEFNLVLNKISSNVSEARGNITFKKPFDDSIDVSKNKLDLY